MALAPGVMAGLLKPVLMAKSKKQSKGKMVADKRSLNRGNAPAGRQTANKSTASQQLDPKRRFGNYAQRGTTHMTTE